MSQRTASRHNRIMLDREQLGVPGVELLGHYRYVSAEGMLRDHDHVGAVEICYLARGRQVYRVDGRNYAMSAGDLFVTYPGEEHSTGEMPQEKGELYWLQLHSPCRRLLGIPAASELLAQLVRVRPRHFAATESLRSSLPRCFAQASECVRQGGAGTQLRLEVISLLGQVLVEIFRSAQTHAGSRNPSAGINGAIQFVHANIERPILMSEMAAAAGLSESWFKTHFRQATGFPPAEYVLREKIERASQLLSGGERVTDVAMRLGFSSSQYFATVFRRFTGQRPGEIRRA